MAASLTIAARGDDGRPVPARFYVVDGSGKPVTPVTPHVSTQNDRAWASERHFVADEPPRLEVAPGRVSLIVERGPEFVPQAREVELSEGEDLHVDVTVTRWVDMNAGGWFSGDLHGHRNEAEVPLLLRAEELNVGTSIATQWRDEPPDPPAPPTADGWLVAEDATHAYSRFDAEVERIGRAGPGALVAVGLRQPIRFPCRRWFPPDSDFAELAHAAGGHVDAEKPVWATVPVLAALGALDSVGLVANHFTRGGTDLELAAWGGRTPVHEPLSSSRGMAEWLCELYYRLLNCGLRFPVSGGSASGIMPNPLGYNRTYVRLDGAFSYDEWLRGLKAGRSFATNGPMLNLTADGDPVGSMLPAAPGRAVEVRAEARWLGRIDRLELVIDGEVVADAGGAGAGTSVTLERELPADGWSWLAARAFAGPEPTVRFAHTSPIYLAGCRPPRRRSRDAALLVEWVDETLAHAGAALHGAPARERAFVLDPIRQAAAVYRSLRYARDR